MYNRSFTDNGSSLFKITIGFISLATLTVVMVGWLTQLRILPMQTALTLSVHPLMQVWIAVGGVVIGTIVPLGSLIIWWRVREIRYMLGIYLLALLVQILTEGIVRVLFFPSIVVLVGTLYTAFRVWYLWQARRRLAAISDLHSSIRMRTRGVVLLLLLTWLINLTIVLLGISWRSIL